MNLFNTMLSFLRPAEEADQKDLENQISQETGSFAPPRSNDGAMEIETDLSTAKYNPIYQQFYSTDPRIASKADLINTYRGLMGYPEVENAVSEIIDDAIVSEKGKDVVSLDLSKTKFSEKIQKRITEEFSKVTSVYNFDNEGMQIFRDWYVDSRIYFHKITNSDGEIVEFRKLDPRAVEFVRESYTENENGIKVFRGYKEYFVYTPPKTGYQFLGQSYTHDQKIKLPRSSVVYAHSGMEDCSGSIVGFLHRAVKPANQLRLLEDAMVIYRITRAPERRVFYVDVGQMGGPKATQYVNNIAQGLKNRVVYDSSTGTVKNQQNNLALSEDYWLMRRDGKAVTEVDTLPGGSNFSDMDDIKWFNRKLYEALRVPLSRMPRDDGGIQIGGAGGEITRDELKFSKFIRSMQTQFSDIFVDPLHYFLITNKVITEDEWQKEKNNIHFVYQQDSYYTELKDIEIMERRLTLLATAEPIIGKYISHKYAMKNILQMTDEETDEEAEIIKEESKEERFKTPDNPEDF
ncbi:portal vertex protein [Pectobacterium phage POP12]|nr:portal vertex protein [Pectobacterium phage POP12]